jgi:hypothetical protein
MTEGIKLLLVKTEDDGRAGTKLKERKGREGRFAFQSIATVFLGRDTRQETEERRREGKEEKAIE